MADHAADPEDENKDVNPTPEDTKEVDPELDKVTDRAIPEDTYDPDEDGPLDNVGQLSEGEEIAARTTDTDEKSTNFYTKKFIVSEPFNQEQADAFYSDNVHQMASVVQDAINVGLRADGDVEYVGAYPHETADTAYVVEYRVPVIRARDAEAWTMSPSQMLQAGSGVEADAHAMVDAQVKNEEANTPAEKKDAAEATELADAVVEDNKKEE